MRQCVADAFKAVSAGYSVDRVVTDQDLNRQFTRACSALGLSHSPAQLNLCLLNLRKASILSDVKCTRRTYFKDQGEFSFASEIAVRSIERKKSVTLDQVLCEPELALEFDEIAANISPGHLSLEYRWAALALRKKRQLRPELLGRMVLAKVFGPASVASLDVSGLPLTQGLYIFANQERVLYIGEAINLKNRLRKHLDHSDNKFLAKYLWEFGADDLILEYHVLPSNTPTKVRKAMELELIRSRRAEFNVQR